MRRLLVPEPDVPVEPGKPPTFSVVIRTYQLADTVAAAVESALEQTLPPLEVIVCDDGSTDGTDEALRAYYDRIVYLPGENAGPAAAFNRGVAAARGDFVAILDGDDLFEPDRVEALSELAATRPDLDILTTDAAWESGGQVVALFNGDANPFEVDDQRAVIAERCFIAAPAVRRAALLELGGHDVRFSAATDWDCWLRMILGGSKAGSVGEPLYRYRLREASNSDDRVSSFRARVEIFEAALSELELFSEDRARLERSLEKHRAALGLAEAYEAARRGSPDARALALAVAREPAHGRKMRARAAALAAAPSALRPWLVGRLGFPRRIARREVGGGP